MTDDRRRCRARHPSNLPPLPGGVTRSPGDAFHVPVRPAGGFEAIVAALTRKLASAAVFR